ncbi:MAG TPA: hypothetical protein VIX37_17825, partial [Candidatus Sulfotelmatobacter sp.]
GTRSDSRAGVEQTELWGETTQPRPIWPPLRAAAQVIYDHEGNHDEGPHATHDGEVLDVAILTDDSLRPNYTLNAHRRRGEQRVDRLR